MTRSGWILSSVFPRIPDAIVCYAAMAFSIEGSHCEAGTNASLALGIVGLPKADHSQTLLALLILDGIRQRS